jgi:hypothetical protein
MPVNFGHELAVWAAAAPPGSVLAGRSIESVPSVTGMTVMSSTVSDTSSMWYTIMVVHYHGVMWYTVVHVVHYHGGTLSWCNVVHCGTCGTLSWCNTCCTSTAFELADQKLFISAALYCCRVLQLAASLAQGFCKRACQVSYFVMLGFVAWRWQHLQCNVRTPDAYGPITADVHSRCHVVDAL